MYSLYIEASTLSCRCQMETITLDEAKRMTLPGERARGRPALLLAP